MVSVFPNRDRVIRLLNKAQTDNNAPIGDSLRIEWLRPIDQHDRDALVVDGVFQLALLANQELAGFVQLDFVLALGTSKNVEQLRFDHWFLLVTGGSGAGW
jgi:hypothetical protein